MQKLKFIDKGLKGALDESRRVQAEAALTNKFLAFLNQESFVVEGGYTASQVQLRVSLVKEDGSYSYPVETVIGAEPSAEFDRFPERECDALFDMQDSYWSSFLEGERDVYVSLDWTAHPLGDFTVFIRGQETNPQLIAAADQLLEEEGHGEHQIDRITSET